MVPLIPTSAVILAKPNTKTVNWINRKKQKPEVGQVVFVYQNFYDWGGNGIPSEVVSIAIYDHYTTVRGKQSKRPGFLRINDSGRYCDKESWKAFKETAYELPYITHWAPADFPAPRKVTEWAKRYEKGDAYFDFLENVATPLEEG